MYLSPVGISSSSGVAVPPSSPFYSAPSAGSQFVNSGHPSVSDDALMELLSELKSKYGSYLGSSVNFDLNRVMTSEIRHPQGHPYSWNGARHSSNIHSSTKKVRLMYDKYGDTYNNITLHNNDHPYEHLAKNNNTNASR